MLLTLLLTGCKSPCEKVVDYLVEECDIVAAADMPVAEDCKSGTVAACEAECTLATECTVHVPPTSMTGDVFTAFLKAVETYEACITACTPDTDTEPEDTSLF